MATTDRRLGFEHVVETLDELREAVGLPDTSVASKIIGTLDHHCREFIARSPFFLLATADASGRCDVSPRGGPAGFVEVLDDRRLVWGEARGNNLADSLRNIRETGRAGLLFVLPGLGETLRVNARACITRDPAIIARHVVQEGRPPKIAIGLEVEEAYLHCAKAFMRSSLWKSETWPSLEGLARPAQIWSDHVGLPDVTLEDFEQIVETSYRDELY